MSEPLLSAMAGVLLSLLFSYVPGLSAWYETLDGTHKRLVMLAALLGVAGGALGLSCLGVSTLGTASLPACDQAGLSGLLEALVLALIANQTTYLITPKAAGRRGEGSAAA